MRRTVAAIAMAVFLLVGCQRDASAPAPRRPQGEKPAVEPDETGLQGDWIEVHALAKEQPMGKGDYYVWVFSEDRVTWRFHNTIDGKPIDGKTIGTGTFKIDITVRPKKMDIDWGKGEKTPCIYELNGDTLKLNTGGTKRPTTFEDGEIFVLQRQKRK